MAVTILPPNPKTWGHGLAEGIGSGLEYLVQNKLNQIAQQKHQAQLASALPGLIPGLSPERYEQLAQTPMELLSPFIKQELQRPEQEAMAQILGLGGQQPQGVAQDINKPAPRLSPKNALEVQKLNLKKELADISREEKVMPFIERETARASAAQEGRNLLQQMKNLITKNKDKWPTAGGYIPDRYQRDPDVREYARLANNFVTLKSNMLRGMPTNYRTQLLAKGKIDLSQPYETQIKAINNELADADKILEIPEFIEKAREENNGRYPRDLASKIYGKQHTHTIPNDLPDPAPFVGKKGIRDKELGVIYYTTDGIRWKVKEEEPQAQAQVENESEI